METAYSVFAWLWQSRRVRCASSRSISTVLDCSRQSLKKREKSDGCKSDRGSDEGRAYRDVHRPILVQFIRCSRL